MRESAISLQEALQTIEKTRGTSSALPSEPTSVDTTQVLERLHHLDTVKTALEKSYSVLREAESWSSLDSEITTLIASQSYAPAASRLSEASRSLALFSNTPEYESRRALMISLQNQLEASLSSALVAAINKRDVATCKSYYVIFTDIQREVEFRNYYFGSRRKNLVELWVNARPTDCSGETSLPSEAPGGSQPLNNLLQSFFNDFNGLLVEERTFTSSIFPDPQQTLSSFVQSVIDVLHPSFSERLSSMVEHYGSLALPHLIRGFKLAEEFAVGTEKIMQSVGYSAMYSKGGSGGANVDDKQLGRRMSKRMSLSRRIGGSTSRTSQSITAGPQGLGGPIGGSGAWEQALFEPFVDFQSEYAALERKYLQEAVNRIIKTGQFDNGAISDGARVLRERSAAMFDMAEETLDRCMALTHGYGALGLMQAFDDGFGGLLDNTKLTLLSPKPPKVTSTETAVGSEYQELDYTAEDWEAFQQSLHLLETCRAMHDRLRNVDSKVKATFLQFAGMVQLSRVDPTGLYISGTTKGEVQLLMQSALNSAELHAFLEGLIRESQHGVGAVTSPISTPATTPSSGPTRLLVPGSDSHGASSATAPKLGQLLLKGAGSAITSFTQAAQLYLQNIILSPLHAQLASYAAMSWTSQQRAKPRGAPYELQVPTFSLSPTTTIQRVAEGLLNLPRMFELHADDDALAFSIETLPFVDKDSLDRLLAGGGASDGEGDAPDVSPRPRRRRLSSTSSATSGGTAPHINIPPPPTTTFVLTPEMVSSTWLSSLTLSLLSHLTTNILPAIRILSQDGAAQLASDLGYLTNIVRAMNVEWDELDRWRELGELSDEDGRKRVKELIAAGEDMEPPLRAISRMRGWTSPGGL